MIVFVFFFCKQKTAYEMRISDWSSDVCSSDLTRNDANNDLVNGQLAKVAAIDASNVTLETNGRHVQLPTDRPLNMDYAYTTTAHSAQGLTCDRVLYNAESFSRTTDRKSTRLNSSH